MKPQKFSYRNGNYPIQATDLLIQNLDFSQTQPLHYVISSLHQQLATVNLLNLQFSALSPATQFPLPFHMITSQFIFRTHCITQIPISILDLLINLRPRFFKQACSFLPLCTVFRNLVYMFLVIIPTPRALKP